MTHWPELPLDAWQDTYTTLHLWTQIVGKVRLVQTPWINHSWHVPLYLTVRGLTTGPIPYGSRLFQIDFDFVSHQLHIATDTAQQRTLALESQTVADFYRAVMAALKELDIAIAIHTTPNELPDPIPFDQDDTHSAYDPEYAHRCWRVLLQSDRVFREFRSHFMGKVSPVHFFWGSFDLAVTRFS
ncbi:MAG: DUF5996 family protein, partial [Cyanobacteria bacterium P01_A01_bin.135]